MTVKAIHLPTNQTHTFTAAAWDGLSLHDKVNYAQISEVKQGYQVTHFQTNFGVIDVQVQVKKGIDILKILSLHDLYFRQISKGFQNIENTFESMTNLKTLQSD
jgi:hypothetical protein